MEIQELLSKFAEAVEERIRKINEMHENPVVDLDDKSFEKMINSGKVVAVLYTAPWCQPCKAFEPLYEAVARRMARDERFADRLVFARLDTDAYPQIADKQNVDRIPTVIIYYKGNPVDVIVGAVTEDELVRRVREVVERVE